MSELSFPPTQFIMVVYFSNSLRAYVSILPSTLLSCLIILMSE